MKWKKLGRRRGTKDSSFVPGLKNVRNSLSLIRKADASVGGNTDAKESDMPGTSMCLNIAHSSMESLCRIGDEGLDSKEELSYSSIEDTRDTSMKSPHLFGIGDFASTLPQDLLQPIKTRIPGCGVSGAENLRIKNSTMNQSAVEACTLAIDNVSPIQDHGGKRKARKSMAWSLSTDDQTAVQVDSSLAASSSRGWVPKHVNRFLKKFQYVQKEQTQAAHTFSCDKPPDVDSESFFCDDNNNEHDSDWSPNGSKRNMPNRSWLGQECKPKKKLRTYAHEDRLLDWEERDSEELTAIHGESVRTSSPSVLLCGGGAPKGGKMFLQISSIHECLEDSEVPLGREATKKSTVNSDEITALSIDTGGCAEYEGGKDTSHANANIAESVDQLVAGKLDTSSSNREPDSGGKKDHMKKLEEMKKVLSTIPPDQIGIDALNSPTRHVRVYHCSPVIETDPIHSELPDDVL